MPLPTVPGRAGSARLADGPGILVHDHARQPAVYYPRSLHEQPAYAGAPVAAGGLPVSWALAETVLSLPMHPYLNEADQERVIAAVRELVA